MQDIKKLLSNLLFQIIRDGETASKEVNRLYELCRKKGTAPTTEQFLKALISETKKRSRVYIVVDALDECLESSAKNTREDFVRALQKLPETVHVLYTSRWDQSIQDIISSDDSLVITARKHELRSFISTFISNRTRLRSLVNTEDNKTVALTGHTTPFLNEIINTVIMKSDQM